MLVSVRATVRGHPVLSHGRSGSSVSRGCLRKRSRRSSRPRRYGERSLVTIALEFEGHGIGRLLVPLVVRRQARRQLPRNEQRLKEVLELGA
jgi:hypothetical protein